MNEPLVILSYPSPGIAQLMLNRAEKRNALSIELLEVLLAALETLEANPEHRVMIVRGAGPVFCAGLDLAEANDPVRAHRSADLVAEVLKRIATTRLVTIAAVHGAAIAGGAGLMSACDFAYAEVSAQIGYPETKRGLVAALVMTFLRRQLRERDARELLLTGELCDASRAEAIGLLNRAVPADELMPIAMKTAHAVLQGGPAAVRETKRLLGELWPKTFDEDFERAFESHVKMRASSEVAEGVAAFREKRPPSWAP